MDQKFKFGGTIVYGDSYLECLFRHFKLIRLHAKLKDAAGAVRAHSGKGPGYCYLVVWGPISCLLGHVTGLLFCLYVKPFLPSIFNSFDFWSSMSFIELDVELADTNVFRERIGSFYWWQRSGTLIPSSKKMQTHKTSVLVHKKLARKCVEQWTFGLWWAFKYFRRAVKGE